jgi:RNA polymerase sigma factor (sigma-70 family)
MGNESPTTRVLLRRWHAGDQEARDQLLAKHLDWIRLRVHQRLGPSLRARGTTGDYVQDVACEVLQYLPRFVVEDGDRFRALVGRIVENVLRDKSDWYASMRRSRARERPLPADTVLRLDLPREKVVTPSSAAHAREQEAWVRLGLDLLDEVDRTTLILRDWEGATFAAIGEKLGMSVDRVERRYRHAFERLALKVKALRRGDIDRAVTDSPRDEA